MFQKTVLYTLKECGQECGLWSMFLFLKYFRRKKLEEKMAIFD
jgi:hypothetical protein